MSSENIDKKSKANYDRHVQELSKDTSNSLCADCGARGPRWASYNLGVFLCIRCGGLHRKLGTHVSKIKSITLDSWSEEQYKTMLEWGNARANAHYMPYPQLVEIPDQKSDYEMEQFISDKYEKQCFRDPGAKKSRYLKTNNPADFDKYTSELKALKEMGFKNTPLCIKALEQNGNSIERAAEWLCSQPEATTESVLGSNPNLLNMGPVSLPSRVVAEPKIQLQREAGFKFEIKNKSSHDINSNNNNDLFALVNHAPVGSANPTSKRRASRISISNDQSGTNTPSLFSLTDGNAATRHSQNAINPSEDLGLSFHSLNNNKSPPTVTKPSYNDDLSALSPFSDAYATAPNTDVPTSPVTNSAVAKPKLQKDSILSLFNKPIQKSTVASPIVPAQILSTVNESPFADPPGTQSQQGGDANTSLFNASNNASENLFDMMSQPQHPPPQLQQSSALGGLNIASPSTNQFALNAAMQQQQQQHLLQQQLAQQAMLGQFGMGMGGQMFSQQNNFLLQQQLLAQQYGMLMSQVPPEQQILLQKQYESQLMQLMYQSQLAFAQPAATGYGLSGGFMQQQPALQLNNQPLIGLGLDSKHQPQSQPQQQQPLSNSLVQQSSTAPVKQAAGDLFQDLLPMARRASVNPEQKSSVEKKTAAIAQSNLMQEDSLI